MSKESTQLVAKSEPASLTAFAGDMITASCLPRTIMQNTGVGMYLQIKEPTDSDLIAEIILWRTVGQNQTPLIKLSYHLGDDANIILTTTIDNPIGPMSVAIARPQKAGENSGFITRNQALAVIVTMVKYLETSR